MYLRSLELQGFKSFPDKIKLHFDKGLTAVVGPNGCGKSNIGDAVRWVLGEQSTKTLRGNKMEDVIFSGTKTRKAMGFAAVTLEISNEAGELGEAYGAVVSVTRKLYRSGDSEYRINGKNVRLKDVTELFMDTGMGRDGYAIIGQGRIAEIVSACNKPSDSPVSFSRRAPSRRTQRETSSCFCLPASSTYCFAFSACFRSGSTRDSSSETISCKRTRFSCAASSFRCASCFL